MKTGYLLSYFATALSAATEPGCVATGCDNKDLVTVSLASLGAEPDGGGFVVDAGPLTVGETLDIPTCRIVCNTPPTNNPTCKIESLASDHATVDCGPFCTGGRLPAGYRGKRARFTSVVGEYFAHMAALEAASVTAFRGLGRELAALHAPRTIARACRRAARDEIRHARSTAALARRHDATPAFGDVTPRMPRCLEALAVENAVEGCVRETFGALVAHWQARQAKDPVVRTAMIRIARDETRHSVLSWRIDAWAKTRLDPAARARIDSARTAASRALLAFPDPATNNVLVATGLLPPPARARALAASLERDLWAA